MSSSARSFRLAAPLVLLLISACASPNSNAEAIAGYAPLPGKNAGTGLVLTGPDLTQYGGTLLTYLHSRVSGMVVDYRKQPCPDVILRGRKSLLGSNSPIVYVDGARASNSCVLNMLPTRGLTRVEVYPMGISHRPGYEAHANGLILVFVEKGPDSEPRNLRSSL